MYLSPEVDIFEMKTESVICGSLTDPDDYNNGGGRYYGQSVRPVTE